MLQVLYALSLSLDMGHAVTMPLTNNVICNCTQPCNIAAVATLVVGQHQLLMQCQ